MRSRKAFTTVELLLVIGILLVLIGLVVIGLGRFSAGARTQATGLAMETLKSMLEEYQATQKPRGLGELVAAITQAPVEAPDDVSVEGGAAGPYGRFGVAVTQTQAVMRRLLAVPGNRQKIERLPSNSLMDYGGVPIVLDGWGNPIIFVPPAGLDVRNRASDTLLKRITAPGDGAFFASAGENGRFQGTPSGLPGSNPDQEILAASDDNIYSFEN